MQDTQDIQTPLKPDKSPLINLPILPKDDPKLNSNIPERERVRAQLRAKIAEQKITRSNIHTKSVVLDRTLKKFGLDKDKFVEDLENVRGSGRLKIK